MVGVVSLGNASRKTAIMQTGTITTTAVTADQVIKSYTVTTNKTFYLQYISVQVFLSSPSATAGTMGKWSLETPSGTKDITFSAMNPTTSQIYQFWHEFSESIPVATGVVVRLVCTPSAVTSTVWEGSFGGFEV